MSAASVTASADEPIQVGITNLDGTPLSQAGQQPSPPPTFEDALRKADERGNTPSPEYATPEFLKAVDEVAHRPPGQPAVAQEIPPIFLAACENDPRAATKEGHVFHRVFWCQRYGARAWAKRGNVVIGEATLNWIAVAMGSYKRRTIDMQFKPTFMGDNWGVYENINTTTLSLGPVCGAQGSLGCNVNAAPLNQSLAAWKRDVTNQTWYGWLIDSDETQSTAQDKTLFHQWHLTAAVRTPIPAEYWDWNLPDNTIRCDSATYFPNDPLACINADVVAWLPYFIGLPAPVGGIDEVALHIRQALNEPSTTFPPSPFGKKIPGKYIQGNPDAPGLHRIPGSEEGPNRDVVRQTCALLQKPSPSHQCDEYPFASTQQGAASPDWDYSVKYVDGTQNQRAGGQLVAFYNRDRILHKKLDQFFVNIIDVR